MALSHQDFAILAATFQPEEHEFVNDKIYIKETAVSQRIEEVDIAWEWIEPTIERYDAKTEMATVSGTLIICGTRRFGVGSQSFQMPNKYKDESEENYALRVLSEFRKSELEKGSATDCMKRAARLFGIGRYLLKCPKTLKKHGTELNEWLAAVDRAQDWTPQFFEQRCYRNLGLVRQDLVEFAAVSKGWREMKYQQKFAMLQEVVGKRVAETPSGATLTTRIEAQPPMALPANS